MAAECVTEALNTTCAVDYRRLVMSAGDCPAIMHDSVVCRALVALDSIPEDLMSAFHLSSS